MTTSSATHVATLDELRALVGRELGISDWLTVGQDRIDLFADATDDHQWIHVDAERAKDGPFGGTIAHGYLTLSLLVPMWQQTLTVESVKTTVNYGLNKVRFTTPVPAGARVRLRASLHDYAELTENAAQATFAVTIDLAGSDRPAVVAEVIFRMYETERSDHGDQ